MGWDIAQLFTRPVDRQARYARWATLLVLSLLLFRLMIMALNPAGLHGDEAQYWAWAQDPAFGYYSKPPLIAWIIWTTTALFGDAEWAVRLASPFLHSATAAITFLTARRLFGAKAGWLACGLYILMPGVALSATLISTDAALLFCLSLFLYAWVRVRKDPSWRWVALAGFALGLGFLAKYAMIYVLAGFVPALFLDRPTRRAFIGLEGILGAAIAAAMISPNLVWNARNDFATLSHTRDNANMGNGPQLNPAELFEFVLGQFGVFGPLTFVLLLVALWLGRGTLGRFGPWLVLLVLTPLLVISAQALLSRANANWAAAAYAAAPIVLAGWAVQSSQAVRWVMAGLLFNAVLNIGPSLIATSPSLVDRLGFANAVKRQRGWPETVEAIRDQYDSGSFEAVAVDNRLMFYALTYYGVEDTAPLFMWRYEPRLNSHAELTSALPEDDRQVLIASYYSNYTSYFDRDFETLIPMGQTEINLGGDRVRTIWFYAASGYRGPVFRN